jgi:hypothetical protein
MHITQSTIDRNTAAKMLGQRAQNSARLLRTNLTYNKADAVDALWCVAVGHDIIDAIGVDAAQAILAEAFQC